VAEHGRRATEDVGSGSRLSIASEVSSAGSTPDNLDGQALGKAEHGHERARRRWERAMALERECELSQNEREREREAEWVVLRPGVGVETSKKAEGKGQKITRMKMPTAGGFRSGISWVLTASNASLHQPPGPPPSQVLLPTPSRTLRRYQDRPHLPHLLRDCSSVTINVFTINLFKCSH
jgi:hypothetical protein